MIHVYKLNLPKADLATLSAEERAVFILAGHTLNTLAFWLKLIRRTSHQNHAIPPVALIEGAQNQIAVRSMLGAIVEAWKWINRKESRQVIENTYLNIIPLGSKEAYMGLGKQFGSGVMNKVRNGHAYHYPTSCAINVAFDKAPADEDWSLYPTNRHTNSSYLLCELVMSHSLPGGEAGTLSETFYGIMEKAITIASDMSEFLAGLMSTIVEHHFPHIQACHVLDVMHVPDARQVTLPFYLENC